MQFTGQPGSGTQNELNAALIKLDANGFTVKIHTAGDRFLFAWDSTPLKQREKQTAPVRVATNSDTRVLLLKRISRASLSSMRVADLSPYLWFPSPIIDSVRKALGARGFEYWPTRDLLKSGAPLLAGSDWPSVSQDLNPWVGLRGDGYSTGSCTCQGREHR